MANPYFQWEISHTLQRNCQHAACSFHEVIGDIGAGRKPVTHFRPVEDAVRPEALPAGIRGMCVHLHSRDSCQKVMQL